MTTIKDVSGRMHLRRDGSLILEFGDPRKGPHEQFDFHGSSMLADRIVTAVNAFEANQARIAELEKALRPFAECAPIFDVGSATRPSADDDGLMSWNDHRVEGERGFTVGDLRAARAALSLQP
jgi:hypothetical protein